MTKANALRGWRKPEEKPAKGVTLLVVFREKNSGLEFISQEHVGYDHALSYDCYDVLAWQYCPIWDEEGKE